MYITNRQVCNGVQKAAGKLKSNLGPLLQRSSQTKGVQFAIMAECSAAKLSFLCSTKRDFKQGLNFNFKAANYGRAGF